MSMLGCIILVLAAVGISVFISQKCKTNLGVCGLAFAWIIGVFCLGMSTKDVMGQFPSTVFVRFVMIMMFYGVAIQNGTLKLMAMKMLYPFRKHARLMPVAAVIVGTLISSTAGNTASTSFYPVILLSIAVAGGWSPILFCSIAVWNNLFSAAIPFSQTGVILDGIIQGTEYAELSSTYTLHIYVCCLVCIWAFMVILYFVTGAHKIKTVEMEKPEPFNAVQKKNLALIGLMILLLFVPGLGKIFAPGGFLAKFAAQTELACICAAFAVAAYAMKLGDQKVTLTKICPWGSWVAFGGIVTLINVASKYGAISWLGTLIGTSVPTFLVGPLLALVGAAMGLVMSYTAVIPVLFPLVFPICQATGLDPTFLFCSIFGGTVAATMFPYSAAGMMVNMMCPDEGVRNVLFKQQLVYTIIGVLWMVLLSLIGVQGFWRV